MAETLLIRLAPAVQGFRDWLLVNEQGQGTGPVPNGAPDAGVRTSIRHVVVLAPRREATRFAVQVPGRKQPRSQLAVAVVVVFHCLGTGPVFQQDVAVHPQLGRAGGGLMGMVGLGCALCDHQIRTLRNRFSHQEFELACLISACTESCAVVAFDIDVGPAQVFAQAW